VFASTNPSDDLRTRGAKRTLWRAHEVAASTKATVTPPVEGAVARAVDAIDHLSS